MHSSRPRLSANAHILPMKTIDEYLDFLRSLTSERLEQIAAAIRTAAAEPLTITAADTEDTVTGGQSAAWSTWVQTIARIDRAALIANREDVRAVYAAVTAIDASRAVKTALRAGGLAILAGYAINPQDRDAVLTVAGYAPAGC